MPRRSQKKQTRLAFASTAASPEADANDDNTDRFARLSYGHPSMASVRSEKPRKSKSQGSKQKSSSKSTERESPDLPQEAPVTNMQSQVLKQEDDESSDDDIIIPSSQRKRRAPADHEVLVMSPPTTNNSGFTRESRHLSNSADSNAVEANDFAEETLRPRRRLKRKAESSPIVLSDLEDSEEPVVSSPVKRRRPVLEPEAPRTPRTSAKQDKLDIEEDLRDLQDSVVKRTRTRGRVAESARDKSLKHLKALRRRRAGLSEESESDSYHETSPTHQGGLRGQEVDSDVESSIASDEDLDQYEDDFVLEDENTELGVPTEEIPFEFTRHAYKQPKEYFRDVVGWMVHNRLDPAFPRSDVMYEMAFMKLEDEVKGRAGSQLISSVWNSDFRNALLARPHIEMTAFPTTFNHSCDACRRSGHPASTDMKLYGKAYSLQTLEPLSDESDESDEDRSEKKDDSEDDDVTGVERDRDGHVLPDPEQRFYLGRHCKDKAQLAHTLTHWRYHLNEWVVDYLERMGHMADAEVLRRSNLSQKRKTRNAIEVIDKMREAGEIDKLWRDFHMNLKSAREKTSILG